MKKGKKEKNYTVSFTTEIQISAKNASEAEEKLREEIEETLGYEASDHLMDIEIDEE